MNITVKETSENQRSAPRYIYNGGRQAYLSCTWASYNSKPRLYVHADGESILENFVYRFDRPAKLYKKLLPQILEALGLPSDTKAVWSQKAGCSCGCSPGFVLTGSGREQDHVDFYATITVVEGEDKIVAQTEDPNSMTALERFAALKTQVLDPMAKVESVEVDVPCGVGRGDKGNLRNFKQMSVSKLMNVRDAILDEGTDAEAIAAVSEEIGRRGL